MKKSKLLERAMRIFTSELHIPGYLIALLVILAVAFDLRIESVLHTQVDTPLRSDARQYFLYAYNLKTFNIYSQADTLSADATIPPAPDAIRTPGYPLFVLPFISDPPSLDDIMSVSKAQAYISTLTVLLVFLLARFILPVSLALTAAALTAMSPHLVTMNVYLLSETLFSFLLILAIFLIVHATRQPAITRVQKKDQGEARRFWLLMLAGMVLAAATLTHPMLLFFVIPLIAFLLYRLGWKVGRRKALMLLLGFALLFGPWLVRNEVSLGILGDSTLMRASVRSGAYRNLTYRDDPRSYGYPYRFDSGYVDSYKDFSSVGTALADAFREAPLEQLRWYLVSKPILAWSWANAEGPSGVFVYPVIISPYFFLPHFKITNAFMHYTHWIIVALMVSGAIIAWLPIRLSGLEQNAIVPAQVVSLLLLYQMAVVVGTFPLPRYSIPMRSFLYVMAMIPLAVAWARFAPKQVKRRKAR